jgi:hypothetical protein
VIQSFAARFLHTHKEEVLITYMYFILNVLPTDLRLFKISEISGKFRDFWKIPEFPENPEISENVGKNFRDFGENFFSEFRKFQNCRELFRKIPYFS